MLTFNKYTQLKDVLLEEKADPGVVLHLSHLEDLVVEQGKVGFTNFSDQVTGLLNFLMGLSSDVKLNLKVDGSPMIAFGADPRPQYKGQFFVSTKSGFNVKFPKINHTPEEIDTNHTGVLAQKLKVALEELSKVYDGSGLIYQGDLLFSNQSEKTTRNIGGTDYLTFKPNVLVYAIPEDPESELYHRVKNAKLGIILHDSFKGEAVNGGNAIKGLPAGKNFELIKELGKHNNVFIEDSTYPAVNIKVSTADQLNIQELLKQANHYIAEISDDFNDQWLTNPLLPLLKMYLNSQVRLSTGGIFKQAIKGQNFNIKTFKNGFTSFVKQRFEQERAKRQRDTDKIELVARNAKVINWLDEYLPDFTYLMQATYLMIQIKYKLLNLVNEIESKLGKNFYQVEDGSFQAAKGEGFVSFLGQNQVKLVDRLDFSKMNFSKIMTENVMQTTTATKRIGIFAGAFKPPTEAHYEIAKRAAQENDSVYIFIGPKERPPITAAMAEEIWRLYLTDIRNVKIKTSQVTPIKDMYDLIKKVNDSSTAGQFVVNVYVGEDDIDRFDNMTKKYTGKLAGFHINKMPRLISAGSIRNAIIDGHWDEVARNIPDGIHKEKVLQILKNAASNSKEIT